MPLITDQEHESFKTVAVFIPVHFKCTPILLYRNNYIGRYDFRFDSNNMMDVKFDLTCFLFKLKRLFKHIQLLQNNNNNNKYIVGER